MRIETIRCDNCGTIRKEEQIEKYLGLDICKFCLDKPIDMQVLRLATKHHEAMTL